MRILLLLAALPSVNVIGKLEGTDPKLREEYVLFSSHQDANGVRLLVPGDSVLAGADDNGSVSVAQFAAARAFASKRPALDPGFKLER